ncbi:MAG TPA: sigma-70 family RNA polymerase sigma factor [Chthonomonadaceae bacterium]|nr:sigma-70 family RNA polymerase sigma factor [Chthonomonadaceae bacterium]
MQERSAPTTPDRPLSPLRPLQTEGRYREPQVEAQIQFLLACPPQEFWRRARLQDRSAAEWVQDEALVSILRHRNRRGESEAAWQIAELLIERSARFIYQHIRCWRQLTAQQVEECIRDVQVQMLQDLFSEERRCEFWEVRFWLCLKRRLINLVQKYRAAAEAEMEPSPIEDDEGRATDFFDRVSAPDTLSAQQRAEIAEALALLTDQERTVFVLYHYEDWPQQQIAAHLNVTDRTVRNLLSRAQKRLEHWRTDNLQ